MIKVVRFVKVALAVVVDDGIWQIFKFNSRRPQRWLLNLKFYQRSALWMLAIELLDFKTYSCSLSLPCQHPASHLWQIENMVVSVSVSKFQ